MNASTPLFNKGPITELPPRSDRRIGAILVDSGKLKIEDAERVFQLQKQENCRFGEAAIKLGLISEDDFRYALAAQFDYACLQPQDSGLSRELVSAFESSGQRVEALRVLRSQLMLRWLDHDAEHKTLAIVSPNNGDGRTYLAANLAVVFSQFGERTLLIDADLRKPRLHKLFNLTDKVGLSSLLSGRGDLTAIEKVAGLDHLFVLPAGVVPPNPQELLARPAFMDLVRRLVPDFDVIVFDTPAGNSYADAQLISAIARAAVMTTRQHVTRLADAQEMADKLRNARTQIVGTILASY